MRSTFLIFSKWNFHPPGFNLKHIEFPQNLDYWKNPNDLSGTNYDTFI
jgi:hypothetical protein